jgi:hypothetical protein
MVLKTCTSSLHGGNADRAQGCSGMRPPYSRYFFYQASQKHTEGAQHSEASALEFVAGKEEDETTEVGLSARG